MTLKLNGSTSGYVTIDAPAVAGTTALTLPATSGTVLTTAGGQTISGNTTVGNLIISGSSSGTTTLSASATASGTITLPAGTGTVAVQGVSTNIVSGTSQASTSGTSIDFTSIPSWVKRITVMFNQVSTNGATNFLAQIGAGSFLTSGYVSANAYTGASAGGTTSTAGYILTTAPGAANNQCGHLVITSMGSNIWISSCVLARQDGYTNMGGGSVTLSGTLDRVRITTVNGTDVFDAGSINILYE